MRIRVQVNVGTATCDHIMLTPVVNDIVRPPHGIVTTKRDVDSEQPAEEFRGERIEALVREYMKRRRAAGRTWSEVIAAIEAEEWVL